MAVCPGGVCLRRDVCPGGVSGGCPEGEVSAQRGEVSARGCLPRGCLAGGCLPRGVSAWGSLARGCLPDAPPCGQNDRHVRVPTRTGKTGKPGKMGRHFPVREKSGNFEQTGKVREKSGKTTQNTGKLRKFQKKIICYFSMIFK